MYLVGRVWPFLLIGVVLGLILAWLWWRNRRRFAIWWLLGAALAAVLGLWWGGRTVEDDLEPRAKEALAQRSIDAEVVDIDGQDIYVSGAESDRAVVVLSQMYGVTRVYVDENPSGGADDDGGAPASTTATTFEPTTSSTEPAEPSTTTTSQPATTQSTTTQSTMTQSTTTAVAAAGPLELGFDGVDVVASGAVADQEQRESILAAYGQLAELAGGEVVDRIEIAAGSDVVSAERVGLVGSLASYLDGLGPSSVRADQAGTEVEVTVSSPEAAVEYLVLEEYIDSVPGDLGPVSLTAVGDEADALIEAARSAEGDGGDAGDGSGDGDGETDEEGSDGENGEEGSDGDAVAFDDSPGKLAGVEAESSVESFDISWDSDEVTLRGAVPTERQRDAVVEGAGQAFAGLTVVDELTVDDRSPALAGSEQRVFLIVDGLSDLASSAAGELRVRGSRVDIELERADASAAAAVDGLYQSGLFRPFSAIAGGNELATSGQGLLGTVTFLTDDTGDDVVDRNEVARIVALLATIPEDADLYVTGHADSRGSRAYNEALGQERAERVAGLLVEAGIDPARLVVGSAGESEPVASNQTAAGRQANRRVDVGVIGG